MNEEYPVAQEITATQYLDLFINHLVSNPAQNAVSMPGLVLLVLGILGVRAILRRREREPKP
jgi:hypothetical protein